MARTTASMPIANHAMDRQLAPSPRTPDDAARDHTEVLLYWTARATRVGDAPADARTRLLVRRRRYAPSSSLAFT